MKEQLALIAISLAVIGLAAGSMYVTWLILRVLPDVGVAASLFAWVVVFAAGSRLFWAATKVISGTGKNR